MLSSMAPCNIRSTLIVLGIRTKSLADGGGVQNIVRRNINKETMFFWHASLNASGGILSAPDACAQKSEMTLENCRKPHPRPLAWSTRSCPAQLPGARRARGSHLGPLQMY